MTSIVGGTRAESSRVGAAGEAPHEPLTPFMIAVVVLLPLIVIAKHHANIRRLLAGTEYRFGKSKAAAA